MSCFSINEEEIVPTFLPSSSSSSSPSSSSLCFHSDQFDNCIPDYQGIMYIKSKWLRLWRYCNCRISGTKLYFSNHQMFILTPANHISRFIEEYSLGRFKLKERYIIHIAEGSRIVFSMRLNTQEDWESWSLHFNLALSLSIKLQPTSLIYSTSVVDFDGYFHRNATEMMIQCFAIYDLVQGREKFRELQRLATVEDNTYISGLQGLRLRKAFELQCAKILVEIIHTLISTSNNDFISLLPSIESFHEQIAADELSNSNLLTSYIDDYCYQRIRQYMVSNLKTLGSIRSMCLDQSLNAENEVISPSALPLNLKIITAISFASVYLYNISQLVSSYRSSGFLGYCSSKSFGIAKDLQFRNGDVMSCVVSCYNIKLLSTNSIYVPFFIGLLKFRYHAIIDACEYVLSNHTVQQRYFRGWGAMITTARSGDVELFQYMLRRFLEINPPKQWINWKELLVNACGCNQSIPLIELILRYFESQRPIAPAEILVLLVSSIDTKTEVLSHFFDQYGRDPYSLDMSICVDNSSFVHPSSSYYASMRRFYRALPSFLDRQTLLHVAAAGNRLDLVHLVHSWQPNQAYTIDVRGFLPLHIACCLSSSVEIVKYIYDSYPQGLFQESTSAEDVFWPDIRYRTTIPVHLATSVCLSVEIVKFLYTLHEEHCLRYGISILPILKRCLSNCLTHSNQSFTSSRVDCLKFLIRKMKEVVSLSSSSSSNSSYNNASDISNHNGNGSNIVILDANNTYTSNLVNHYTFLPQYEYMPCRPLNEQLLRVVRTYDETKEYRQHYPDTIYKTLNWKARKGAILIYYHLKKEEKYSDIREMGRDGTVTRRFPESMVQGSNSHDNGGNSREAILSSSLLRRLSHPLRRFSPSSSSTTIIVREQNQDALVTNHPSPNSILNKRRLPITIHRTIDRNTDREISSTINKSMDPNSKTRYVWGCVVKYPDIFRLCVSFL